MSCSLLCLSRAVQRSFTKQYKRSHSKREILRSRTSATQLIMMAAPININLWTKQMLSLQIAALARREPVLSLDVAKHPADFTYHYYYHHDVWKPDNYKNENMRTSAKYLHSQLHPRQPDHRNHHHRHMQLHRNGRTTS